MLPLPGNSTGEDLGAVCEPPLRMPPCKAAFSEPLRGKRVAQRAGGHVGPPYNILFGSGYARAEFKITGLSGKRRMEKEAAPMPSQPDQPIPGFPAL